MLIPTTCVGLRYGPHISLFLAVGTLGYRLGRSLGVLSGRHRSLQRAIPSARTRSSPASLLSMCGYGNINPLSIHFPLRVRVRSRLTPGRLAWPGKPWSFGVGVSRPHYRYLCLHFRSWFLQGPSRVPLQRGHDAPLPLHTRWYGSHGFGNVLMPDHYPCGTARPVSCYALFK